MQFWQWIEPYQPCRPGTAEFESYMHWKAQFIDNSLLDWQPMQTLENYSDGVSLHRRNGRWGRSPPLFDCNINNYLVVKVENRTFSIH